MTAPAPRCLAVLFFALLLACSRPAAQPEPAARAYARLAVALGERDVDSIDYYYGPEAWVAGVRRRPPPLDEIARSARQLRAGLPPTSGLRRQLDAIAARADMLTGASLAFDEESQALFGVKLPATIDPAPLQQARRELARLLPGAVPLAKRIDEIERKFVIPSDRLKAVMERAIAGCRTATVAQIELPPGESVSVEYVRNRPWNAYSLYQGNLHSQIRINTDFDLTIDRALTVACHEAYPGHHVMHSLQDLVLVRGQHREDYFVQPAFSPQSWASEALASYAADIAFPGPARAAFERDELAPLAGLDKRGIETFEHVERLLDRLAIVQASVAREFLDARLEWVRASDALEKDAAMAHTEETLKYISEFRTYVLCYTFGRERAQVAVQGDWKRYQQLLTDPNAATALK